MCFILLIHGFVFCSDVCAKHRFCQVSDLKWLLELASRPAVINLLGVLSGVLGCAPGGSCPGIIHFECSAGCVITALFYIAGFA